MSKGERWLVKVNSIHRVLVTSMELEMEKLETHNTTIITNYLINYITKYMHAYT